MRSHSAQHVAKRKMFAGSDGDRRLESGPDISEAAHGDRDNCDLTKGPSAFPSLDAERCTECQAHRRC